MNTAFTGSVEELIDLFRRTPDVSHRPLQIIHHRFPTSEDETRFFFDAARKNGLGGFVINCASARQGDEETETASYLEESPEADAEWARLRTFVRRAFDAGFRIYIYDELKYPSGAAGSRVIDGAPEYRVRGLKLYCRKMSVPAGETASAEIDLSPFIPDSSGKAAKPEQRVLFAAAYPVRAQEPNKYTVDREGFVRLSASECGTRLLSAALSAGEWLVCLFYCGPAAFETENHVVYTDLLNPDAVEKFIRVTHAKYAEKLGPSLFSRIGAFFTDEPGLPAHGCSHYFDETFRNGAVPDEPETPVAVAPWDDALEREFLRSENGAEPFSSLIALFADLSDGSHKAVRRTFWQTVRRLFADGYFGKIASFCEAHGSGMTGHLYGEETLSMQVALNAGLYSHYKRMQIPGVDRIYTGDQNDLPAPGALLPGGEKPEPDTPRDVIPEKTASSAAHIMGRSDVLSESSTHIECVLWGKPETATPENRLNAAYYQCQLGVTQIGSYYPYSVRTPEYDPVRADFQERTARAFTFGALGIHRAEFLILVPENAAFEHYVPQNHKHWVIGPCISAPYTNKDMIALEQAYAKTLETLLDGGYDFDLVDEEELRRAEISDGKIALGSERYAAFVYLDGGEPDGRAAAFAQRLIDGGGTLLLVTVPEETPFSSDFARRLAARPASLPGRVLFLTPEEAAGCGIPHETVYSAPLGGVRVKKSETDAASLYFFHNRTPEAREVLFTVPAPEKVRLFDTAGKERTAEIKDGVLRFVIDRKEAMLVVEPH